MTPDLSYVCWGRRENENRLKIIEGTTEKQQKQKSCLLLSKPIRDCVRGVEYGDPQLRGFRNIRCTSKQHWSSHGAFLQSVTLVEVAQVRKPALVRVVSDAVIVVVRFFNFLPTSPV